MRVDDYIRQRNGVANKVLLDEHNGNDKKIDILSVTVGIITTMGGCSLIFKQVLVP